MRSPRLTACAALLAAACDPQATTDYAGEPMAQVRGVMSSAVTEVPDGLVPIIFWQGSSYGTQVDVVVRFPSSFTLDLYQPPPDEALFDFPAMSDRPDEIRLGFGSIELLPFAVAEDGRYPLGVAERHMLLYAEGDMAAGTLGADYVGAVLPAGYHLVKVIASDHPSCPGEHDCIRYSSLDLETSIEVRIDWAENLDHPSLGLGAAPAPEGSR